MNLSSLFSHFLFVSLLSSQQHLLRFGCSVTVKNLQQITPLHVAVQHKHTKCVELLIDLGSDLNVRDFQGETPLHQAVQVNFPEGIKLLMAAGAKTYLLDGKGRTPIQIALEKQFKRCEEVLKGKENQEEGNEFYNAGTEEEGMKEPRSEGKAGLAEIGIATAGFDDKIGLHNRLGLESMLEKIEEV
jgi:ankyrin repeat protein